MPPQNADAKRMERRDVGASPVHLHSAVKEFGDAFLHLRRSLVSESDRQNTLRSHTFDVNQVGDSIGNDAGLAATGPRQNKQRPFGLLHRGALLDIQLVEQILHAGL